MRPQNIGGSLKIGDGSRELENAMKSPRRKTKLFGRIADKIESRCVETDNLFHKSGRRSGVARNFAPAQTLEPFALNFARGSDPHGHLRRPFLWRRQHQIRCSHGANLEVEVDPVEQWSGQARLIGLLAVLGIAAATGISGLLSMAATARIRRRDKLEASGINASVARPRDCHFARFERLPERDERRRLEFGQLVEKQDAVMGEEISPGRACGPLSVTPA